MPHRSKVHSYKRHSESHPIKRHGVITPLVAAGSVRRGNQEGSGRQKRHSDSGDAPTSVSKPGIQSGDYTVVVAGRQVRLGPVAFWIVVGTLVIMSAWTLTTATYFAFRDDVLTHLIARQAEMQYGYEDRIAELRTQVDRVSSRQLLDQEQFEQKLEVILHRQATLESRATALNALPDSTVTGSTKSVTRGDAVRAAPTKTSPIKDLSVPAAPRERRAELSVDDVLARLQASLDRVETRQAAALTTIEQSYDAKARRIHGILAESGIDAGKVARARDAGAAGGPFVPVRPRSDAGPFDRQVYRASLARLEVERLSRGLKHLPVRKPVPGEGDPLSGFGVRIDPFLHSPAMHTGVDLVAQSGDPVRATADGTITVAGWQGGYGKVIEIDHGNGLATRYGHLSLIEVTAGQSVKIGQVIGRVGTTGRSTAPHLHYETRIDGEAADPQKFLRAGARLGGII
jgi:murein DD-endopeptidase MepM/ murein hydrolase activator NlpD